MKLVLTNVAPWDGEYDMDFAFTNREMHRIRQVAGLRGAEVLDALMNDDAGAYVAVALIVLARNGKHADVDELWDTEAGSIRILAEPVGEGGDAGPPELTPSAVTSNGGGENGQSSGPSSNGDSGNPDVTPATTGTPGSVTHAA